MNERDIIQGLQDAQLDDYLDPPELERDPDPDRDERTEEEEWYWEWRTT